MVYRTSCFYLSCNGGNGAGKTTTLKCILGIAMKVEGEIWFSNYKYGSINYKSGIGYSPDEPFLYSYLNSLECFKSCVAGTVLKL
jgi:ABC-type multidrug transport system ATPase subunit